MNKLYIDTRDNKRNIIRLETKDGSFEEISEANIQKAQTILPLIEKLLKKAGIKPAEIEEINVETGPGSFTGLKVGVAIANVLSFSSKARLNGRPIGEIEQPQY